VAQVVVAQRMAEPGIMELLIQVAVQAAVEVRVAQAAPVLLSSNTLLQQPQPYSHLNLRRNG
jgi:hypothetical protein